MTNAPCANAPSLRYDGPRRAQATPSGKRTRQARGASIPRCPGGRGAAKRAEAPNAAGAVDEREHGNKAVEPVEQPAVSGDEAPGVLGARHPLEFGLQQVARLRRDANGEPQRERGPDAALDAVEQVNAAGRGAHRGEQPAGGASSPHLRQTPLAPSAPSSLSCPYDPRAQCPRCGPDAPCRRLHLAPFRPHPAPNRPQNASFRPRIGLIRRRSAGVNGAK